MNHSNQRSYLQAALNAGEKNIITAFDNKRRLQKEKDKTDYHNSFIFNLLFWHCDCGFDPSSFMIEGGLQLFFISLFKF